MTPVFVPLKAHEAAELNHFGNLALSGAETHSSAGQVYRQDAGSHPLNAGPYQKDRRRRKLFSCEPRRSSALEIDSERKFTEHFWIRSCAASRVDQTHA
jgi:hypothetical protein